MTTSCALYQSSFSLLAGVVSSPGKGIASASGSETDCCMERGLSVTMQKFDPYINVDPGTMSPDFQHGECYVTDGGARPTSTSATTNGS